MTAQEPRKNRRGSVSTSADGRARKDVLVTFSPLELAEVSAAAERQGKPRARWIREVSLLIAKLVVGEGESK